MFIRIQPVKYARGMNNAVTMYTIAYTEIACICRLGKQARKDQFETIKSLVLRCSYFVGYWKHHCYLVKLLISSLLVASERGVLARESALCCTLCSSKS